MKKLICLFLLFTIFPVSLFAQTKKNRPVKTKKTTEPARVPPKDVKVAKAPQTLGVTVEKYTVTYEVNPDGTSVETWEMRQRFTTDVAAERFSKFEREFNGDLEKAEVLDAFVIKADGKKLPVASNEIQIAPTPQAEAAPSFSSVKEVKIDFKNIQKGDATYFKLRLSSFKTYFQNQFSFLEIFPVAFDWNSIEINLTTPQNFPLYVQAVDLEGGKIGDENGKTRWQWRKQNLAAFKIETAMFDFFNSSPRLAVTSFKNFEELGAAYWSEAQKKSNVTPEIQALADEITKDLKEPQQQAYAIYEWVNKNIRYLSIVLDRGGWIPHSTTEILANRYGDCKDYSIILHSLLKAKNIESYPVLIRADFSDWFPEVAVPDYFNHAILYIPSLKMFADATSPNTRLGLIPQVIVGKKAVLAGERTGIVETPKDNPDENELLSEVEINFEANGSLKAVSKNTYNGRTEVLFRPLFADSRLQRNSGEFVRLILAYYGINGNGKILKVGNPFKVGEPFTIELEVEIPDFTTFMPKGSLPLPVALNLTNSIELGNYVTEETRQTNLILGATRIRESFILNFPADVKIETLPSPINFSNSLGSYRNEFVLEGNQVKVIREFIIKKDIISPKEYPQIRELITKLVEGFNAEIKYSANPLLARQKSRELRNKPAKPTSSDTFSDYIPKDYTDEKPLTVAQASRLEAKLKQNPDDIETRKKLLRYYTPYTAKETPARKAARLKHRLWFVQNRPELEEIEIYGYFSPIDSVKETEYQTLKAEWLKQVANNKNNPQIRLNAVDFLRSEEPELAEKLLLEGREIDKENYDFPLILSEIAYSSYKKNNEEESPEEQKVEANLRKAFENGEAALTLLKKERSSDRDRKRRKLLQDLVKIGFEYQQFERVKSFATELILDFGQNTNDLEFEESTHIGNIYLGLVALAEGDVAKAKEYLLISIRAPLRKAENYLTEIDTKLAQELFEKGEKEVVLEYLRLCESLWHLKTYKDLYADEIKALKLWQEEIKQGKTPDFKF